jgi:hypothetical protein
VSVTGVMAGLAVVETTLKTTGVINHVFDVPPNSINTADLSCFVNFPGIEKVKWDGSDEKETAGLATRVYHCLLYIIQRGAGVSGEIVRISLPILDSCRTLFQAYQTLGGQKGITKVVYLGDSGIRELMFAGMGYIGIDFQVEVTERIVSYYAANE